MKIYKGTIICESQRAFLIVSESQLRFLLLIINKNFEKTFNILLEKSLIGEKVLIEGNDDYHIEVEDHQNCDKVLFFTEDSVKEI